MTISIECFPPKDQAGEDRLWAAMAELQVLAPDFIAVTYGAGGGTRDRTTRITKEITEKTGINTVAHLTCVGSSKSDLVTVLEEYKSVGIKSILALRGDPAEGPSAPWVTTPGGFDHADQLVELASQIGGFEIGVAAFPDGHPASNGDLDKDIDVLVRKEQLGASFATTQFFFESNKWISLVEKLQARGSNLPIYAGILPITNVKQLKKMSEFGGTKIPEKIEQQFTKVAEDADSVRKLGVELATQLCQELLEADVPGLHFFTMNTSSATLEIVNNLGLGNRGAK